MGKILCFIYDGMVDFEMTLACSLLDKEVFPIAYEIKVIKSKSGMCYYPISIVKEALEYTDVDGLIIPGGYNDEQRNELTELINELNNQGKLLAAICAGPQYLARAGVLKGKKYTTTLTEDNLKEYFPMVSENPFPRDTYINENVVRDSNIITAVGNAFVDFSIEILDYFGNFKDEEEKKKCASHYKGLN
ncbi:DJ-1/PfpI family protein [Clostridium sp. BL-8]|uniref:DJ-1/PfpI family protein n=1 Tax=Clostridium sp. BL-8 TaxID=349938 RepID=UPI00098C13BD|nr:DJ-1/PfpI family protein [Clostridium sp. BL-8]OOM80142.1 transcriptional activator FtrA [Clostridium sp. BL-8]